MNCVLPREYANVGSLSELVFGVRSTLIAEVTFSTYNDHIQQPPLKKSTLADLKSQFHTSPRTETNATAMSAKQEHRVVSVDRIRIEYNLVESKTVGKR